MSILKDTNRMRVAICIVTIGIQLGLSSLEPALPTLQLPTQSSFPPDAPPGILNTSNLSDTELFASRIPRCLLKYGHYLRPASCIDAWESIPTNDTDVLTFGARSQGPFDVPLPHRFLSEDGLCAIDILTGRGGGRLDSTTWADISEKAALLVKTCVLRRAEFKPRTETGGMIGNVGRLGALAITVSSYQPDVSCNDGPDFDDGGRCKEVLDTLPVGMSSYTFERSKSARRTVTIGNGKRWTEPEGRCSGFLSLESGSQDEVGTYWDIWTAAVAVDRMCVRHGEAGVAFGIGNRGRLIMDLSQ